MYRYCIYRVKGIKSEKCEHLVSLFFNWRRISRSNLCQNFRQWMTLSFSGFLLVGSILSCFNKQISPCSTSMRHMMLKNLFPSPLLSLFLPVFFRWIRKKRSLCESIPSTQGYTPLYMYWLRKILKFLYSRLMVLFVSRKAILISADFGFRYREIFLPWTEVHQSFADRRRHRKAPGVVRYEEVSANQLCDKLVPRLSWWFPKQSFNQAPFEVSRRYRAANQKIKAAGIQRLQDGEESNRGRGERCGRDRPKL